MYTKLRFSSGVISAETSLRKKKKKLETIYWHYLLVLGQSIASCERAIRTTRCASQWILSVVIRPIRTSSGRTVFGFKKRTRLTDLRRVVFFRDVVVRSRVVVHKTDFTFFRSVARPANNNLRCVNSLRLRGYRVARNRARAISCFAPYRSRSRTIHIGPLIGCAAVIVQQPSAGAYVCVPKVGRNRENLWRPPRYFRATILFARWLTTARYLTRHRVLCRQSCKTGTKKKFFNVFKKSRKNESFFFQNRYEKRNEFLLFSEERGTELFPFFEGTCLTVKAPFKATAFCM